MTPPRSRNPRLAEALIPALVHRINNTTQLLVVLRSVLAEPDDGLLATAGSSLAHASRDAEEQGWLLGLLARSLGTDLLLAREERDGLAATLKLLAEALRRQRKQLALPESVPTMTLAEGGPRTAALCLDLAALVWEFRKDADAAVRPYTAEWPVHRQPVLDRNALRLGWYGFTHGGDAVALAIDETVELVKTFSTEKSGAFVNAVLVRVAKSGGSAR